MRYCNRFVFLGTLAVAGFLEHQANAQVFGQNLVMNGDAETGSASQQQDRPVTDIPAWNRSGNPDVAAYGASSRFSTTAPGPTQRGLHYFIGGPANSSSALTQQIDISADASVVDTGLASYDISAYLGGIAGDAGNAKLSVDFKSSSGQILANVTLGPVDVRGDTKVDGLYLRRQIGLVPTFSRQLNVTLTFTGGASTYNNGAADNVSIVINQPGNPQSLIGRNLILNGGAESATAVNGDQTIAADTPNWVRTGQFDVEQYKDDGGRLSSSSPGPADRGMNYFSGGPAAALSTGTQDIDVSSAVGLIDTGTVTYDATAWLGGNSTQGDNAAVSIQFQNWTGVSLGSAALAPVTANDRNNRTSLLFREISGLVPPGTRLIHVVLTMTRTDGGYDDGYADNLSLILGGQNRPAINPNGVISLGGFGGSPATAPGSWIEIYGSGFSTTARTWSQADFAGQVAPTSLYGTSVTVGGLPAYVSYISPGQVDALLPAGVGTGPQPVVVTSAQGSSDPYYVMVNPLAPALNAPATLQYKGKQYVAALFSDGATYALPAGAIQGYLSRPAKPGDSITIFGIGFGSVNPNVAAGTIAPAQATNLTTPVQIFFGGVPGGVTYQGLAPGLVGLYQFNVVVPNVPNNDAVPVTFLVNGMPGAQTLYIAIHN